MKHSLPLLLFLSLFAGCSEHPAPAPGATPVSGVIALRPQHELADEPAAETASRAAGSGTLTYTFEAWTRGASPRCVLHQTTTGTPAEADIEIALVPGTYDFLFWADSGRGYYTTTNLRQVTAAASHAPAATDERDAFACAATGIAWNGGSGISATLVRPLAKLTMRNSKPFGTDGKPVSVTYRNIPTQYDVLTGKASAPADMTRSFPPATAGSAAVGEDFLFAASDAGSPAGLAITVGEVRKELDVLQLQPNYETVVTATFE